MMRKFCGPQLAGFVALQSNVSPATWQSRGARRRKITLNETPEATVEQQQQRPTGGPLDGRAGGSPAPQQAPRGNVASTISNVRGQIDELRVVDQKQRFAAEMRRMAKEDARQGRRGSGGPGGGGQGKELLFGPQKPAYARGLLERSETLQMQLLAKATQADMEDVLRKDAPKYAKALQGLDPGSQRKRLERADQLHAMLHGKTGADGVGGDAALVDALDELSDEQLLEAMRAGVVDPFTLQERLAAADAADEADDTALDEAEEAADGELPADSAAALTDLPNEFFQSRHALTLTSALSEHVRAGAAIEDDVAPVLAKVQGNSSYRDFTEQELQLLEGYEQAKAQPLGDRRNAVLNFVAERDAPLRRSLEVMERTKLAASLDTEFQEAMKYSRKLEARDRSFVKATARFRPGAADTPLFFGSGIAKSPKRAQLDLPALRADKYRRTYASRIVHARASRKKTGGLRTPLFKK